LSRAFLAVIPKERAPRLPALAAELVRLRVAVLVAAGAVHTAQAAKAATSTIPIAFANGSDPVKFGLLASLNRPGASASKNGSWR